MADYRELLRKAIDALPENTGANRRAVYEKARSALVAQLRAIDPPLPAREITQHRLNLEDCIREVEQEATDALLGRYRESEETGAPPAPESPAEPDSAASEDDEQGEAVPVAEPPTPSEPADESSAAATDGDFLEASEEETEAATPPGVASEREPDTDMLARPAHGGWPEAPSDEGEAPTSEPDDAQASEPSDLPELMRGVRTRTLGPVEAIHGNGHSSAPRELFTAPIIEEDSDASEEPDVPEPDVPEPEGPEAGAPGASDDSDRMWPDAEQSVEPERPAPDAADAVMSIEDIIAAADATRTETETQDENTATGEEAKAEPDARAGAADSREDATVDPEADLDVETGPEDTESAEPRPTAVVTPLPVRGPVSPASVSPDGGSETPRPSGAPAALVDIYGKPLASGRKTEAGGVGEAMSAVREVEIDPNQPVKGEFSDPQITIDRAIAALDREARGDEEDGGETSETKGEDGEAAKSATADTRDSLDQAKLGQRDGPMSDPEADSDRSGGFGALTIFLIIAVVLLAGGGAGGFWAWREGYVDLTTVFAQADPDEGQPAEVAQSDPQGPVEATTPQTPTNTTTAEPPEGVSGEAMPGESLPFVEPSTEPGGVEDKIEERLPAQEPTESEPAPTEDAEPADEAPAEADVAAAEGPQSLLLEEQADGASGAVPYSGSVEWSRGTDELGNPTIEAEASIPARNLDVSILLRRNADENLPASHLMEVDFSVSETFVGGSIAGLPGVLMKDEELVQGEPLTGASARIVGNSFLFALSSASEQDVGTNRELLLDRDWLDIAMVYGTGRRAIMTLEKGEDGQAIFDDVMDAWSELAGGDAGPEDAAAPDDGAAADAPETADDATSDAADEAAAEAAAAEQ